jgi:hypothetical protein
LAIASPLFCLLRRKRHNACHHARACQKSKPALLSNLFLIEINNDPTFEISDSIIGIKNAHLCDVSRVQISFYQFLLLCPRHRASHKYKLKIERHIQEVYFRTYSQIFPIQIQKAQSPYRLKILADSVSCYFQYFAYIGLSNLKRPVE